MKLDIMARSAHNFVKIFLRRLSDDSEVAILIPTKIGGVRGGTEWGRVMSQDSATGK